MKAKKVVISLGLAGILVGGTIWGFSANAKNDAKQETQDKEQPKTATVVKETKAETKKTKEKVKKKEIKEVKKVKPKKVKKAEKQQKQVVSEQPQQKERIVASEPKKNNNVSKAPVKKEQPKVYRNTTGSSSPSKNVQTKNNYVSNGGSKNNTVSERKVNTPKKSKTVPKKAPSNDTQKKTSGTDWDKVGKDLENKKWDHKDSGEIDSGGNTWDSWE
ncbi:hypothetical protein B4133_0542 [Bacillus altitudinis]|uniref:hypothetical protein n=1 Tax=Bacillus altitudinis TaxID=293387 RepID=UPI0005ADBB4C|nr:hypothetical protein [Bacillus altitudinis]KIL24029.1 hypothetical protein B4133_0542 [Bacillus altitudinis]